MSSKNFSFRYKGKKFNIQVEECKTILQKARGLMFRQKSPALLFYFKDGTREAIHSFFCKPFAAIWFLDDKIIDLKFVKPWKISIKPANDFNKLLEIPSGDKFFLKFCKEIKSARNPRG